MMCGRALHSYSVCKPQCRGEGEGKVKGILAASGARADATQAASWLNFLVAWKRADWQKVIPRD